MPTVSNWYCLSEICVKKDSEAVLKLTGKRSMVLLAVFATDNEEEAAEKGNVATREKAGTQQPRISWPVTG